MTGLKINSEYKYSEVWDKEKMSMETQHSMSLFHIKWTLHFIEDAWNEHWLDREMVEWEFTLNIHIGNKSENFGISLS